MGQHVNRTPAEELDGALNWWREAGVDLHFADEAQVWIIESPEPESETVARPKRPSPPLEPAEKAPPPLLAERANWPQNLSDFQDWWRTTPMLDQGGIGQRVSPRGVGGAQMMILVAEPEADDSDHLLSGPLGRFLDAMLDAMDISPENTYRASVLPRNTPLADWAALTEAGLGEVTLHHIGLVGPERVMVFGRNILPLIGHDPTQNPASLVNINHQNGIVPLLAGWDLAALLSRPKARSAHWQRWLEWTDG